MHYAASRMKRLYSKKLIMLASVALFAVASLFFFAYASVRLSVAEKETLSRTGAIVDRVAGSVDQNSRNAWELARVLASWIPQLPLERNIHEGFLEKMLMSAEDTSIYGIGIWYDPGKFPSGDGRFGLYGHFDRRNREKLIITYKWNSADYDYSSRPWFGTLRNSAPGIIVNTEPYFDSDFMYISYGCSFLRNSVRSGVVTVDLTTSSFSSLAGMQEVSQLENLVICTKAGSVVYASSAGNWGKTISASPGTDFSKAIVARYREKGVGVQCIERRLSFTDWSVIGVYRDGRDIEALRLRLKIEFAALAALWAILSAALWVKINYANQRMLNESLESENTDLREEISRRLTAEKKLEESWNELRALNDHLNFLAFHDPVTDLPNTAILTERIADLMAIPSGQSSLVIISYENLRDLSSVFDRDLVDFMLKNIASRLLALCGRGCEVYRGAGFVFYLVACDIGRDGLVGLLGELAEEFRKPISIMNARLRMQVKLGVSEIVPVANPSEILIRAASALVSAPDAPLFPWQFYSNSHRERRNRMITLDAAMMDDKLTDELSAVFQPIVNMRTDRIEGFETLLRWTHPDLGPVSPAEFIPLAEENGRIIEMGWFVLERAVAMMRSAPAGVGDDWFLTVNISPLQFMDQAFIENVEDLLLGNGLPFWRLKFEITEIDISKMQDSFWAVARSLHERGFRFAIDDFGTGQSSLSRLNSFQFETVKIDRSFVTDICMDDRHLKLVQSILGLSLSLGSKAVAEGIETQAQRDLLMAKGCIYAQGFFYFKPLVADDAYAQLIRQNSAINL